MSLYLGLLAASVAALLFGSVFVPLKRMKTADVPRYNFFMTIGIFITSLFVTIALSVPFELNVFGILAGVVWSTANSLQIASIKKVGLAKSTAIPLGMALLIAFIAGTLLFSEPLNIYLGILGVLIFLAGIFLACSSAERLKVSFGRMSFAFTAGFLHSLPTLFFKLGNLGSGEFLFSMSLGIMIISIPLFLAKSKKIFGGEAKPALTSGVMWGIGMLGSLYAITFLGLAIGQPLTQLALLVGVLWGLFYFKEIADISVKKKIMLGAVLLFAAGTLLTFSKVLL